MRLWDVSPPRDRLYALSSGLGADVPVCLHGRAAEVSGVGAVMTDAPPLPEAWLALVNPGAALSTPAVFKARAGDFSAPSPLAGPPGDVGALAAALKERRNDLTEAAIALAPEVGRCIAALAAAPGCLHSRMSGSGATCWGLFETGRAAGTAARALKEAQPTWWVRVAPLLTAADPIGPIEALPAFP